MARRPPTRGPLTAPGRASPSATLARSGSIPDGGLFGPGSATWELDREAWLLLGAGPRALLLQLAHPAVAAGVADHSDFRTDPWGRLAATLRAYLRIVYGTTAEARAEIRRLNGLHGRVRGALPDGERYAARDPELSLWVHATLVDSTLAVAAAWRAPLEPATRARAYADSIPVGRAFGIPARRLPRDIAAFDGYVAEMLGPDGPAHPGPLARELAVAVLEPPPGPPLLTLAAAVDRTPAAVLGPALRAVGAGLPAAATAWLLWPSIGLLPPSLRAEYGLAWGPRKRAVSAWLVAGWRGWSARLPASLREMPQARAADDRMRGATAQ